MAHTERDSGIELLRIVLMVMILFHHFAVNVIPDGYWNVIVSEFMLFGGKVAVVGFVIITGFFSVNRTVKLSKIVKLNLECIFWSVGISAVFLIFGYDPGNIWGVLFPLSESWWFVRDYLILMLLSPVLNCIFRKSGNWGVFWIICISVFTECGLLIEVGDFVMFNDVLFFCVLYLIGGYVKEYPVMNMYDRGFCFWAFGFAVCLLGALIGNSGITGGLGVFVFSGVSVPLIGYAVGSGIICYVCRNRSLPELILGMSVLWGVYALFRGYESAFTMYCPVTVSAGIFLFLGFKNLKLNFNAEINWFASSVLAVYFIHESVPVRTYFWELIKPDVVMYIPCCIGIALFFLVTAVTLDKAKEWAVFRPVGKKCVKWAERLNKKWNRSVGLLQDLFGVQS